MIRYGELSSAMRAFMGGFQAFRKLGFKADDIYFGIFPSARLLGSDAVFCVLRAQGLEFNLECAPAKNRSALTAEYARVSGDREISEEDLERIWQESEPYHRRTDFVFALVSKGFVLRDPKAN